MTIWTFDYFVRLARIVGMRMGRPSSPDTTFFRRVLSHQDRAVLLALGNGDLSDGWREMLALGQHVYMLGYRQGMRPENIKIIPK